MGKITNGELTFQLQGIGASQDAARMQRVVSFYEKLPRGPAPKFQPKGLIQRYMVRYAWGESGSKLRMASFKP